VLSPFGEITVRHLTNKEPITIIGKKNKLFDYINENKRIIKYPHEEDIPMILNSDLKQKRYDYTAFIGFDWIIEKSETQFDESIDALTKNRKMNEVVMKYFLFKAGYYPLLNTEINAALFLIIPDDISIQYFDEINDFYNPVRIATRQPHILHELFRINNLKGEIIGVENPVSVLLAGGSDCALVRVDARGNNRNEFEKNLEVHGFKYFQKPILRFTYWYTTTLMSYKKGEVDFNKYIQK
jgi:hypothetical protein